MQLDKIDLAILKHLQLPGKLSNQELASKVGLSPSPCSRRVKALEDAGYIASYSTQLNPERFGLNLTVYIQVSLEKHNIEVLESFEQDISAMDEVQECSLITGNEADYLLKVLVADMQHYKQFLLDKLTSSVHVAGIHSSFVLKKVKNHTSIPLPAL
ncbi:Lrp/AsnC family transcriptional regulator [Shewanella sp. WXL01]|uniref:Lrp/AsnC family transcriptional regulator n=1 Tax=Shewanella maritima TaxID=2520507 RepID=A0A411PDV9_9GAMM|nr:MULTISPECIES: Lrp/AsnC family transcriptional regulator [Shewanella]NKF50436.1 Lrp/AsnC family transcriptional regulator [Shewanella sp. WXL01]QBF81560.1 Lrp/AsnC family transcriptional regulator [Shewanella maritima]